MMSAGSFIVACMKKTPEELRRANIVSAARQHEIPVEWAQFYLTEEMNRCDRGKRRAR